MSFIEVVDCFCLMRVELGDATCIVKRINEALGQLKVQVSVDWRLRVKDTVPIGDDLARVPLKSFDFLKYLRDRLSLLRYCRW